MGKVSHPTTNVDNIADSHRARVIFDEREKVLHFVPLLGTHVAPQRGRKGGGALVAMARAAQTKTSNGVQPLQERSWRMEGLSGNG